MLPRTITSFPSTTLGLFSVELFNNRGVVADLSGVDVFGVDVICVGLLVKAGMEVVIGNCCVK